MIRIGVTGTISAAHRDDNGFLHGHSWRIRAWFPEGGDALKLEQDLRVVLALFDHQELLYELARSEGLVEAIAEQLPDALEIEAARPVEGIYIRWTR